MTSATLLKGTDAGLNPGEVRATGINSLNRGERVAILAIAAAGLACPKGRVWIAQGHRARITNNTIASLRTRGLMGGATRTRAGLTETGRWYARSIVSDLAQETTTEETSLCPIIDY